MIFFARQDRTANRECPARPGRWRFTADGQFLVLVLLIVLAGCGAGDPLESANQAASDANSTTAKKPAMTESTQAIAFADFTLLDPLGRPMEVTDQGVVSLPNGTWGRIHRNGTVTDPQGGIRARLSDGRVIDQADQVFALLAEDGTAKVGDREFGFDADGKLDFGGNVITLVPANSPARRAAMLVVLVAMLRPAQEDIDLTPKLDLNRRISPRDQ